MGTKNHFGFLEHQRRGFAYRKVAERIRDFDEVAKTRAPEIISIEAQRCMNCGVPYCHSIGCPLKNLIPEWNELVANGNWREAYERLELTSNLSEFTGRICPAPCESACTLAIHSAPVSIRQIELAIVERGWQEGWVEAGFKRIGDSGQSVAIVGSGPAGLAAAQDLRRFGHRVVVLEKRDAVGGLLRYGIPDYKLPKNIVLRRVELMRKMGIIFQTNVEVGTDIGLEELRNGYDAIILACGAEQATDYVAEGRELGGVHWAMEYLIQVNKRQNRQAVAGQPIELAGKNVLVLGAGDTSSDCIGSARREGAARIIQASRQIEPPRWGAERNPTWPMPPSRHDFLETSSAQEEYCERLWQHVPVRFHDDDNDGHIDGVTFAKVLWHPNLQDPNERAQLELLEDETLYEKVEAVLIAIGFEHTTAGALTQQMQGLGMGFDRHHNPCERQDATPDIFCVGDMVHGASLVVSVAAQGREVAARVQEYLETLKVPK